MKSRPFSAMRRAHSTEQFLVHPVKSTHEKTQEGVRFNVQTVPPATQPLNIPNHDQQSATLKAIAQRFYHSPVLHSQIPDVTIEAHSAPVNLVDLRRNVLSLVDVRRNVLSLLPVLITAFANHFPLVLGPEDIWLAIATGAALHINDKDNAEKLRENFVSHKGKKKLTVRKDHITMGSVPKQVWEQDIFPDFSEQIRSHIGERAHDVFAKSFSSTKKAQQAAMDITLMAAMKQYFSYRVFTLCGIPWIELKGTRQDWVDVRDRASDLGSFLLPQFSSQWLPHLLPVLDEFVLAYDGRVNHEFWQRMCKVVKGVHSGESDHISGWINNLYPYLQDGRQNRHVKPWKEMNTMEGPDPEDFPMLLSSVPAVWDYYGIEYPLHFHAGYLGMTQDPDSLALSPYVGWMITHDPPKCASPSAD